MAATSTELAYDVWETFYDRRFSILEDAVRCRDTHALTAVIAQDRLSEVDHVAMFNKQAHALSPDSVEKGVREMDEMRDRIEISIERTKTNCNVVKVSMENTANSPRGQDAEEWKKELDRDIQELEEKTCQDLNDLKTWGKKKISGMAKELRSAAAKVFMGLVSAIQQFLSNAVTWLEVAIDTVVSWKERAWDIVRQWTSSVHNWSEGVRRINRAWFGDYSFNGGRLHYLGQRCRGICPVPGSILTIEDITSRLQRAGLESLTLVRNGNDWDYHVSEADASVVFQLI